MATTTIAKPIPNAWLQPLEQALRDPNNYILYNLLSAHKKTEYLSASTLETLDTRVIKGELSTPDKVQEYSKHLLDLMLNRIETSLLSIGDKRIAPVNRSEHEGTITVRVWVDDSPDANALRTQYKLNTDCAPAMTVQADFYSPKQAQESLRSIAKECAEVFSKYLSAAPLPLTCLKWTVRVDWAGSLEPPHFFSETRGLMSDFSSSRSAYLLKA